MLRRWQWRLLWLSQDTFMLGISGVVSNAAGEVLLLRHRYWKAGSWGLPSGYAEKRERLQDTLRREVREETGYDVEVGELVELRSGFKLRAELTFRARIVGGELEIDPNEILEARFFRPDALPDGLLPNHRALVRLVLGAADE